MAKRKGKGDGSFDKEESRLDKNKNCTYTQNRELSWLKFNNRVLDEALDESVPLFERMKFVEIFTGNLDEFFMVRVGSLFDMKRSLPKRKDNKSGLTAKEQLKRIFAVSELLTKKRDKIFAQLERKLAEQNILRRTFESLDKKTKKFVEEYFRGNILPLLSPIIVTPESPLPANMASKGIWVAALLKYKKQSKKQKSHTALGLIALPPMAKRLLMLPGKGTEYILLEDIISAFMGKIFPTAIETAVFAITRNADISVIGAGDEELFQKKKYREIIINETKDALMSRPILPPVRLEIQKRQESALLKDVANHLDLSKRQIVKTATPLSLSYVYELESHLSAKQKKDLCYDVWTPVKTKEKLGTCSVMERVEQGDLLLSYPYDDFGTFLDLVQEAVKNPTVTSIKITIYRIGSGHVELMHHLMAAAESGKRVTVLLELKARFDEANNMGWVSSLSDAGCRVLYGFPDCKVHAKICLIKKQAEDGSVSYITQVGTGNFNAKTAKLYADYSLLTANKEIGKDAELFFHNVEEADARGETPAELEGSYEHFLVAPRTLKSGLLKLIAKEKEKAEAGKESRILLKMNSITDRDLIDALTDASRAGVRIDMVVRGICCILPGVTGQTDNIHIRSIVGRFLEHARVFVFGQENPKVYISSADWMTRNTENRVEIACPVLDEKVKQRLLNDLEIQLSDNQKARTLNADGNLLCVLGDRPVSAQQEFMSRSMKGELFPGGSSSPEKDLPCAAVASEA